MIVEYDQSMVAIIKPKDERALPAVLGDECPPNAYPMPEAPVPYQMTPAEFEAREVAPAVLMRRQQIHALQSSMVVMPDADSGPAPVHLFTEGMYYRQVTLPAGQVIVSKRHAREHFCTISKGSATVFTEDGMTRITGPYVFISPAGAKRVLLVHEDIVWATVHRTEFTDLDEVEKDLIMDETLLLGGPK